MHEMLQKKPDTSATDKHVCIVHVYIKKKQWNEKKAFCVNPK